MAPHSAVFASVLVLQRVLDATVRHEPDQRGQDIQGLRDPLHPQGRSDEEESRRSRGGLDSSRRSKAFGVREAFGARHPATETYLLGHECRPESAMASLVQSLVQASALGDQRDLRQYTRRLSTELSTAASVLRDNHAR